MASGMVEETQQERARDLEVWPVSSLKTPTGKIG